MRKIVATTKAPAAIGPYAQANVLGNLVFTSGQIPLVPETGAIVEGGIEEQTKQVFANLQAVLEEAGSGFGSIAESGCFSGIHDRGGRQKGFVGVECPGVGQFVAFEIGIQQGDFRGETAKSGQHDRQQSDKLFFHGKFSFLFG
jgi:hypothetical protein